MHKLKLFLAAILIMMFSMFNPIAEAAVVPELGFDPDVDYFELMINVIKKGGDISEGRKYELMRNKKVEWLGNSNETGLVTTDYFDGKWDIPHIRYEMGLSKYVYTDADLDLLSRIINAEAGCSWIPDWVQRAVGSVVLNRLDSPKFPNTIKGVIYQPGAYGPIVSGMIHWKPQKRCIENARYILDNGKTLPDNVFGQGPRTGRVHSYYYDWRLGSITYFCYG